MEKTNIHSVLMTGFLLALFTCLGFAAESKPASGPGVTGTSAAPQAAPPDDAALKAAEDRTIDERYAKWKATLTPKQQQWEDVLAANLGPFYFPVRKKNKAEGVPEAWDYVEDDPKLPRVLLIGDSISRGYTLPVRAALAGKANVHRAPENCGPSSNGLKKLSVYLGDGKWDVIHFNFGIHDRATESAVYEANLEQIVSQLEKTGARLIWARTTPVLTPANAEKYTPEQCARVNQIADRVMQRHHIPTDDLCSLVEPRLAELQLPDNVHFKEPGYQLLGGKVAAEILTCLGGPNAGAIAPPPGAPVETDPRVQANGKQWRLDKARVTDPKRPRVLLIGDSILNGYQPHLIKKLDGKAYVDAWVNPYHQSEEFNKLLAEVLEHGPYDVVHFNMGLHGWQAGRIREGAFESLTKAFVEVIRRKLPHAGIIWASTTPVTIKGKPGELDPAINPIIVEQNRMAARVMQGMHVPTDDFYPLLAGKLNLAAGDGFHWTPPAYQILAEAAAQAISQCLPAGSGGQAEPATASPDAAAEAQHAAIGMDKPARESNNDARSVPPWFADAGLGLFIHYGISAVGGAQDLSWGMITNKPWDRGNRGVLTPNAYYALAEKFNPASYHPDKWLKAAKDAGFGYAVLTTRHHDGFALWPSAHGDLSTKNFMNGRDLVKAFVDACRRNGLKVGLYYSSPDWYRERACRSWGYGTKGTPESPHLDMDHKPVAALPPKPAGFDNSEAAYLNAQLQELLTHYGQIDYLWFDGSAKGVMSQDEIRKLQPGIMINERQHGVGDVITGYEFKLPAERPAQLWEHCFSMSGAWGYTKSAHPQPAATIEEKLAQTRTWGGNVLANFGLPPDGDMTPEYYQCLADLADWMAWAAPAVIGAKPGPYPEKCNARVTVKNGTWFVHLLPKTAETPASDNRIVIRQQALPKMVTLLKTGEKLTATTEGDGFSITVPESTRSGQVDIVKIEW